MMSLLVVLGDMGGGDAWSSPLVFVRRRKEALMHPGFWETVADTLFWLQLCWIFSGFVLMAYLAFKVFPGKDESDPDSSSKSRPKTSPVTLSHPMQDHLKKSNEGNPEPIVAGNYRLEAFPRPPITTAKIIEFESIVSEQNRRWS
jgi:hypothetical protein